MTPTPDRNRRRKAGAPVARPARPKPPVEGCRVERMKHSEVWGPRGEHTLADAVAMAQRRLARCAADDDPGDLVVWREDKVLAVVRLRGGVIDVHYLDDPAAGPGDAP